LPTVTGTITPHTGRGRQLGIPTLNVTAPKDLADGVYAGYVVHEHVRYPAAIFVGAAITFGETTRQVEAHLLDVTVTLTDKITIELLQYLRGKQLFPDAESLQQQMEKDIIAVKQCLPELSQNK